MSNEEVAYRSRLFEVVMFPAPPDVNPPTRYERARRAPGVRVLLTVDDEQYLLSSEHRREVGGVDLRLPGGKVFETVTADEPFWTLSEPARVDLARAAARRELREELGVETGDLELLEISPCGATIEWDLYYFVGDGWSFRYEGPRREPGEESIEPVTLWATELWDAVHTGVISEGRSAHVIGKYLYPHFS